MDSILQQLDCSQGKWAMIRKNMFYFRSFRGVENTPANLEAIGNYYQNPIKETLKKIVLQDAQIKSN